MSRNKSFKKYDDSDDLSSIIYKKKKHSKKYNDNYSDDESTHSSYKQQSYKKKSNKHIKKYSDNKSDNSESYIKKSKKHSNKKKSKRENNENNENNENDIDIDSNYKIKNKKYSNKKKSKNDSKNDSKKHSKKHSKTRLNNDYDNNIINEPIQTNSKSFTSNVYKKLLRTVGKIAAPQTLQTSQTSQTSQTLQNNTNITLNDNDLYENNAHTSTIEKININNEDNEDNEDNLKENNMIEISEDIIRNFIKQFNENILINDNLDIFSLYNKIYDKILDIKDVNYLNKIKIKTLVLLNKINLQIDNQFSNYIIVINLFIDDINKFESIFKLYYDFLIKKNIRFIISIPKTINIDKLKEILKDIKTEIIINIVENNKYCGYFKNIQTIVDIDYYYDIKFIYFINTCYEITDIIKNLNNIILSFTQIINKYFDNSQPYIICSYHNKKQNIIGRNSDIIIDFYKRYKMIFKKYNINNEDDIKLYYNSYAKKEYINYKFDINTEYMNFLNLTDSDDNIFLNPYYVEKFGCENYYVDNMIFLCNREYFDFFRNFNNLYFEYEIDVLYKTNNPYDKIFGILINIFNGFIIGYEIKNNNTDFDFIEHKNYYMNNNITAHLKPKAKINVPIINSTICIFLNINDLEQNNNIFNYIKLLLLNDISIDFYIGDDSENNFDTIYGISLLKNINLNDIINKIKINFNIATSKINYYIGYTLQKCYNLCIVTDSAYIKIINININKINKICFIPDPEFFINKYNDTLDNNYYNDKFHYICEFDFQLNLLKNQNVYNTKLYVPSTYYNINLTREKSIIFKYDDDYDYDKKSLMNYMIETLSNVNIICYVFNKTSKHLDFKQNNNIILLPKLSNSELNKYFNKSILGCVFSDKYNDKTAFNMLLSGLKVIEYNSKITSFDLPSFIFTKINSIENITEIIDELFKQNDMYNMVYSEYLNKCNNFSHDDHINSVCNYIINL